MGHATPWEAAAEKPHLVVLLVALLALMRYLSNRFVVKDVELHLYLRAPATLNKSLYLPTRLVGHPITRLYSPAGTSISSSRSSGARAGRARGCR